MKVFILDHIKRKCFNDKMKNVVVIELYNLNSADLINLKSVILFIKINFESLIYVFNLIICFKMMSDKKFYFNVKITAYLILKVIDKL